MSRAGRKRKANARRTPSGRISRAGITPFDYGNDRVQARREAFRVFQGGKADNDLADHIGRAWAAGLLEGTRYDAALLRDIGREYGQLFWMYYQGGPAVASIETRSRSSGQAAADDQDRRGERFKRLDDAARDAGRAAYSALHALCVNDHWFPDDNPAWLARLLDERMKIRSVVEAKDRDTILLARSALVAMVG